MSNRTPKCPQCGAERVARILYGMPAYSKQLERDLDDGRIVLGGCVATDDDPAWKCIACEHEWNVRETEETRGQIHERHFP